jgi:S-methylmethionine-dependent homocysteine/selenocysteine methylase/SAM-dependent methyltransferase
VTAASSKKPVRSRAYARLEWLIEAEKCVILDGAMATELSRVVPPPEHGQDEALWGTWALLHAPDAVVDVSLRYAQAGCDVISTNTWGIADGTGTSGFAEPVHWIDVARRGVRVGREAIQRAGGEGEVALGFSINGDINSERKRERIGFLPRVFDEDAPDLVLLETMTLIRDDLTFPTVALLVETGIPVWLSFRRCRYGVCGVYGQHWGPPEGDEFGRAARRLEDLGVRALLLNCLPPDHVAGMLSWLRDFTTLPLGVYPNLGYYTSAGWSFDKTVGGTEYAKLALEWREEGAQIIGGCCGVGPEHIAGARHALEGVKPGNKPRPAASLSSPSSGLGLSLAPVRTPEPWTSGDGRRLYPLPLPEIMCEPEVFVPTQGSFLVWKYLFEHRIGQGARCLDIGCGTGILTVQLALNGAEHVHAIDLDRRAVGNALANAFRNGVADRVTGEAVDLYPWVSTEQYDIIVASLYQVPVDPYEQPSTHRPLDFWGRNLIDHLFTHLPDMLADDGVAYVMQLSILSQQRTTALLEELGFTARVVDYTFYEFHQLFTERLRQIQRVEELSDAHHFSFGQSEVTIPYLLEIRRAT